jgi:hypothetical protein
MNYEKRFLEIRDFLKEHTYLHQLEMLERNEQPLSAPYKSWTQELVQLSQSELINIENTYSSQLIINTELKLFIETAKKLIDLPKKDISESKIPQNLKRKLSHKKLHEISTIKTLLKDEDIDQFIDIGSGAAHLSSCILQPHQRSICIDMNKEFQDGGKEKLTRWSPSTLEKIEFVQKEIKTAADLIPFSLNNKSMILGLHACGPLSSSLVKLSPKRLLNLGCCYHKLKDEYNLSAVSQKSPIWFTNHALTSAAKGFSFLTEKDYKQKYKVKTYRYTLHYFLKEVLRKNFMTLGNGKKSDYELSFSQYCHIYAKETSTFTHDELESYFQEKKEFIESVIVSGVLRSILGRVIEIYIILDRALLLQENGSHPKVFELFNRDISPRNIAILL